MDRSIRSDKRVPQNQVYINSILYTCENKLAMVHYDGNKANEGLS